MQTATRLLLVVGIATASLGTVHEAYAQAPMDESVQSVVTDYIEGADEQNPDRVAAALHDDVHHLSVLPDGRHLVVTKSDYVGALEAGAIGGTPRSLSMSGEPVGESLYTVRAVAASETLRFDFAITLLQGGEGWRIISSVMTVSAQN